MFWTKLTSVVVPGNAADWEMSASVIVSSEQGQADAALVAEAAFDRKLGRQGFLGPEIRGRASVAQDRRVTA